MQIVIEIRLSHGKILLYFSAYYDCLLETFTCNLATVDDVSSRLFIVIGMEHDFR